MPAPSEYMRRLIAAAATRLDKGQSVAEVQLRLAKQFPAEPSALLRNALEFAVRYRGDMLRMQNQLDQGPGSSARNKGQTIGAYLGPNVIGTTQAGIRYFFDGVLTNGKRVQGSVVLNIDAAATIYTADLRAYNMVKRGHFDTGNGAYQFQTLSMTMMTTTPYPREHGIRLDTSKTNPYR